MQNSNANPVEILITWSEIRNILERGAGML